MTNPWPVLSSQFQTERLDLRSWVKAAHARSPHRTLITFKVMDLFTLEPDSDKLTHLHIIYDLTVLPVIYSFGRMRADCLVPVQA
jgi:hypothetical protein